MENSIQYVNVYVPDSLLRFGPFSGRQKLYGYHHTISLERGCRDEIQHTLVVSSTQHSSACEPTPCGASLLLLGEISSYSTSPDSDQHGLSAHRHHPERTLLSPVNSDSSELKRKVINNPVREDSPVDESPCLSKASSSPGKIWLRREEDLHGSVKSDGGLSQTSVFWLSFCSVPYLHLTRVRAGRKDVSLQSVNIIFYSADEIRGAQLLCNNYICDSNTNSSLSFFVCKVKHQPRKQPNSSCVEFFRICVLGLVYLMEALMFFPKQFVKLQSIFSKVFDFQSATLMQLSVRVTQLEEMQRICQVSNSDHQGSFVSSGCSCRFSGLGSREKGYVSSKGVGEHSSKDKLYEKYVDKAQARMKFCHTSDLSNKEQNCINDQNEVNSSTCKTKSEKLPHGGCNCTSTSCNCAASVRTCSSLLSTHSDTLVLVRLVCVVIFDVLLGLLLLGWMRNVGNADVIYSIFLRMAEHVSSGVLELLSWLRGAPAGLKLNQPLTVALATFFSYHVGLWTLYLDVAGGAVYSLCCALVYCGVLGATVQFALLSDLLHFATLHLHCFYVYAARLHMVQISLLGSQWRAFRGNKWNPLKLRVDSLHSRPSPTHHPPRDPGASPRTKGKPFFSFAEETRPFGKDDATIQNSAVPTAPTRAETSSFTSTTQQTTSQCWPAINIAKSYPSIFSESGRSKRTAAETENDLSFDNQPVMSTETESCNRNIQPSSISGKSTPSTGASVRAVPRYIAGDDDEGSRAPLSRVLSAVIFTLVVFLLPTTTVYYVVFLSLRLLLLVARELLRFIPWLIHHNPAFAPCLLLCRPQALAGEVEFRALPGGALGSNGPVALRVEARTSPLSAVVGRFSASPSLPSLTLPSLPSVASSVLWACELL